MIDTEGMQITEEAGIKQEILGFYTNLLGISEQNITGSSVLELQNLLTERVSSRMAESLTQTVTREEIKAVDHSMPHNKSPGPDGYTSEFYQAAWHAVGDLVTDAIMEFFQTGELLKAINVTVITIVPKCSSPKKGQ